jgi:exopolyphosphatase / guanosine-5'-triphosphate,3'-diphosphate pyrophosphatase
MLAAIIDIGSNSVRLVFYDYEKGYPQAIFNEKVTCTLAEGLEENGILSDDAKQNVKVTITRFSSLIQARKPSLIKVLATAAIREASDGAEFAAELEGILQHKITILSGEQEAIYAAYGVIATTWKPHGIVVDMGGGSTDISYINETLEPRFITSIPHGALYFATYHEKHGNKQLQSHINKLLKPIKKISARNIYAVGGSFRSIAAHNMARVNYPLHIIHDYAIEANYFKQLKGNIEADLKNNIALVDVPKRRQPAIMPSVILLNEMVNILQAEHIIFSSSGIREGALAIAMGLHENPPDPLIAMMSSIHSILIADEYVEALSDWIKSYIKLQPEQLRLLQAFCYISEIAANMHPDYRAEYAFERIIAIQGFGLTHNEQVTLALAVYFRYRSKLKLKHESLQLLRESEYNFAYIIGRIACIAYELSAGSAELLSNFKIIYENNRYQLAATNSQMLPVELPEINAQSANLLKTLSL